jgi:hypothetical protein
MDDDRTEWAVLTNIEHEPEQRINEMFDISVKLYEYSLINPSNQLCKTLGIMSKTLTELIQTWREALDEDELYHGCG